ncbi:hypothetical protein PVL95_24900, partial [Escherichia coli]|uniref:hypothetical protein n=1 Tax=Escherichia coli TaxID=562 RepID=UPI00237925BA
ATTDTEQRQTRRRVSGVLLRISTEKSKKMLDSVAGKRIMHTPAPLRKSEAALLFNNLSDNLCGHSKIRILNVARR